MNLEVRYSMKDRIEGFFKKILYIPFQLTTLSTSATVSVALCSVSYFEKDKTKRNDKLTKGMPSLGGLASFSLISQTSHPP